LLLSVSSNRFLVIYSHYDWVLGQEPHLIFPLLGHPWPLRAKYPYARSRFKKGAALLQVVTTPQTNHALVHDWGE
jgi:hypothetical protein